METKRSAARGLGVGTRAMMMLSLAAALSAAACGRGDEGESGGEVDRSWTPPARSDVKGVPIPELRAAIEQRLGAQRPSALDADQWRHVRALYRFYEGAPLWLGSDGVDETRVSAVSKAVVDAHTDGMRLDAYPLPDLVRQIRGVDDEDHPTAAQLADLDVLLSSIYVAVGEDMLTGQVNPRAVSQSWHIDPEEEEIDSALVQTLGGAALDRSIASMRPQGQGYEGLRRELSRYRAMAAKGDWPTVPEGEVLKPGDEAPPSRLAALRARLAAEGLATGTARNGANIYDSELAGAVARFQAQHAIVADSMLGEQTVESMNLPVSYRLGQIAANMERYRWLPRSFGDRFVLVNIPDFRLQAFEKRKPVLDMKVIVGAEYENRATPVFSDSMRYVVFRPYWLVTDSIAAREIFPKVEADPGYLARHGYELYHAEGVTRVRQLPGAENSLGLVKFIFPNDFNIYLHDTPDERLFDKDVRAFSHGCIRVEQPARLAQWVLGWPADRVSEAMHSGRDDHRVDLPRKIPVFIVYFTAFMRNGELRFGNDLYRRDDELVRAVANGSSSAESVRAAEELMELTQ